MLSLIVLSFSIQPQTTGAGLRPEWPPWLRPVWFLGLYQTLSGDTDPAMRVLANRAAIAVALALLSSKKSTHDLADGFEFEFPADAVVYQLLAEWVGGERLCCPFLDIDLRVDKEGGPLRLCLTGREGVKELIKADLPAEWFK
jgi:hypothetical protein